MRTGLLSSGVALISAGIAYGQVAGKPPSASPQRALVNQYCAGCHNDKLKSGGMTLTRLDLLHPAQNA